MNNNANNPELTSEIGIAAYKNARGRENPIPMQIVNELKSVK